MACCINGGRLTYFYLPALFLALVAVTVPHIYAQPAPVGSWAMYFGNQPIRPDWTLWNELQIRQHNLVGDLHQVIVRAGIGHNLTAGNNNVLIGYGFFHSQNYVGSSEEKTTVIEHRLFQQFIHRHNLDRIAIQHRVRIEERFLPAGFRARFRYLLGLNIPLNNDRMWQGAVYASAYNEAFLVPDVQTLDQNRIYAAIGYVFHPSVRAEIGYLRQTTASASRDLIQLAIFNNIALY